jgi:Uncharacterized conserved protein
MSSNNPSPFRALPTTDAATLLTPAATPNPSKPLIIVVASQNPVKVNATLGGFNRMFPPPSSPTDISISSQAAGTPSPNAEWHVVQGVAVPSGVSDQPMTDAETLLGARNRAENARKSVPDADFWVGIEGGVDSDPDDPFLLRSFAWIVVLGPELATSDGKGVKVGKARTATYYLPRESAELIRGGMELGKADDLLFGGQNTKQKNGSVGLLTGNVIDRRGYYEEAVVLALIPFRNRGLTF